MVSCSPTEELAALTVRGHREMRNSMRLRRCTSRNPARDRHRVGAAVLAVERDRLLLDLMVSREITVGEDDLAERWLLGLFEP